MTYYTDKQAEEAEEFISKFMEEIDWLRSPAGINNFADKASTSTGGISKSAMLNYILQYVLDMAAQEISLEEMHDMIASAVFRWNRTEVYDKDKRKHLEPIYKHYLDN